MSIQFSKILSVSSRSMGSLDVSSLELGGQRSSPVLVVDDFRVRGRPFGPHPHAGFSAVTYVFRDSPGSLRNRDSLGGHVVVGPGGACWLHAGSGAQHEEIPAVSGEELWGLQVFVDTSARNKLSAPRSFSLAGERVPVWNAAAGDVVRVVVGSYGDIESPLVPVEPFTLLDVALRREIVLALAEQHNAIVYVRRGDAAVGAGARDERLSAGLSAGQAIVVSGGPGQLRITTDSGAEIVVLAGAEIRERVVVHGPFIMNEPSQIAAAVERYRAGNMGKLEPFREG